MSEVIPAMPISVAKKLHAVMSEVTYIQKDKKNEFHKYSYASEKAIKETLHPVLVKHGLLFLPIGCDVVSEVETVNNKGNKERLMTIRYMYRFVDVESGEYFDGYSLGTGADASDKCIYKAITGACKYILTGTFLIPTGDDPEVEEPVRKGSKEAQQAVADRKLGVMPSPPAAASSAMQKAFAEIRPMIGDKLFLSVLKAHGYQTSEIADVDKAKAIYKQMGGIRKIVASAEHGELLIPGINEEIFTALPDTSISAVMIEYKNKLTGLCGTEVALSEFEALRKKAGSQWEFANLLQGTVTKLAAQQGLG